MRMRSRTKERMPHPKNAKTPSPYPFPPPPTERKYQCSSRSLRGRGEESGFSLVPSGESGTLHVFARGKKKACGRMSAGSEYSWKERKFQQLDRLESDVQSPSGKLFDE